MDEVGADFEGLWGRWDVGGAVDRDGRDQTGFWKVQLTN